jgi:AcrR family transcriptional regulator
MARQARTPKLPRHRHNLPRDVVRQTQAERLVRAAAEVVAAKGYRATTIADIVKKAGVSTKTFYDLFADKEAALCAVYDGVDAIIEGYVEARAAAGAIDPRLALHAAVAFVLDRLAADTTYTRLLVVEAVGGGPRIQARRNQVYRRVAALIADALRGSRPALDEKLIVAYLGGLTELVLQHIADAPVRTLPVLVEPACRFTDAIFFPRG